MTNSKLHDQLLALYKAELDSGRSLNQVNLEIHEQVLLIYLELLREV